MADKQNASKVNGNEKISHGKLRIVAALFFLILSVFFITRGVLQAIKTDSGWREIEAEIVNRSWSGDFVFQYNVGYSGASASEEYKAIKALYTEAMVKCYRQFNNDKNFKGVHNVHYINEHPNEVIEVDELLYQALEKVASNGTRQLYLAPIHDEYDNIFLSETEEEAYEYDPIANSEVQERFKKYAEFANDGEAVSLELLGENKIRLNVSEEYREYAETECITSFIDFNWMKNAFIADYVAEVMCEKNHTAGVLSSYDGFTRNFDSTDSSFFTKIYNLVNQNIYNVATMEYKGARSLVCMHNYSLSSNDRLKYFETKNGETRTPYLSEKNGINKSSINELLMQSTKKGCADILLEMIPVYISDELNEEEINLLGEKDIYTVYCKNYKIVSNDSTVEFKDFYDRDKIKYTIK